MVVNPQEAPSYHKASAQLRAYGPDVISRTSVLEIIAFGYWGGTVYEPKVTNLKASRPLKYSCYRA